MHLALFRLNCSPSLFQALYQRFVIFMNLLSTKSAQLPIQSSVHLSHVVPSCYSILKSNNDFENKILRKTQVEDYGYHITPDTVGRKRQQYSHQKFVGFFPVDFSHFLVLSRTPSFRPRHCVHPLLFETHFSSRQLSEFNNCVSITAHSHPYCCPQHSHSPSGMI